MRFEETCLKLKETLGPGRRKKSTQLEDSGTGMDDPRPLLFDEHQRLVRVRKSGGTQKLVCEQR